MEYFSLLGYGLKLGGRQFGLVLSSAEIADFIATSLHITRSSDDMISILATLTIILNNA